VVAAGGLGDTVLFSLILPRLLAAVAGDGDGDGGEEPEPVTVLLRSDAAAMAFLFPPEVSVLAVDFKRLGREAGYRLSTLIRLRRLRPRVAVSADFLRHPHLDEALILACNAPKRVAMRPRPWRKYDRALGRHQTRYTDLFDSGPVARDKMLRWTASVDWLAGTSLPPPPIRLPEAWLPPPAVLSRPTILIQPFSAVPLKQSAPAVYLALMEALPGYDFVVKGGPDDMKRNPEFSSLLSHARFDGSSFREALPLIRAASLVVSVDTAMMHLATAAGTPTLCLASAAHLGEMVPYAPEVTPDNVVFLWQDLPCRGCLGNCHFPPREGRYPCVAGIEPPRVVATARKLLGLGRGIESDRPAG
ncbi:MAG: glycosyltransferase family 9 protein, partial [Alphaproteobacteria bacterium]